MSRNQELGRGAHMDSGYHLNPTYQADIEPITAQLAAAHHNETGGSSINVLTGDFAKGPGFMVGGVPGVQEVGFRTKELSPSEVQYNRDRVRATAKKEARDLYAGTWWDDKGGRSAGYSYLDGSDLVKDKAQARTLQARRQERAVFDLDKGESVDLTKDKS